MPSDDNNNRSDQDSSSQMILASAASRAPAAGRWRPECVPAWGSTRYQSAHPRPEARAPGGQGGANGRWPGLKPAKQQVEQRRRQAGSGQEVTGIGGAMGSAA